MSHPAATYIRASGHGVTDRRKVIVISTTAVVVASLAVAVMLAVSAYRDNARLDRLAASGVPVRAQIVSCVALASGTGITAAGFNCKASYVLQGRSHVEVLRRSSAPHQPGDVVAAVADERNPADLSAGRPAPSSPAAYLAPATLTLVSLCMLLIVVLWQRPATRMLHDRPTVVMCRQHSH